MKKKTDIFHFVTLGVAIIFLVLTFLIKQSPNDGVDLRITLFIQRFQPFWFDAIMRFLTFVGNMIPHLFLLFLTVGTFLYFKKYKAGLMLFFSGFGANIVSFTLKHLVSRPRPDPHLVKKLGDYVDSSFPSGHVLFYTGFFGFLLFLVYSHTKSSNLRHLIIIFLVLLLIGIGISRIYMGAHWFSDVLGAYLIGFLWLSFVIHIYKRLLKKK